MPSENVASHENRCCKMGKPGRLNDNKTINGLQAGRMYTCTAGNGESCRHRNVDVFRRLQSVKCVTRTATDGGACA